MIVLIRRRIKKLKADKNNISWIYGIMWLRLLQMGVGIKRSSLRSYNSYIGKRSCKEKEGYAAY